MLKIKCVTGQSEMCHGTVGNVSRDSRKCVTGQSEMCHGTVGNVSRDSRKCVTGQSEMSTCQERFKNVYFYIHVKTAA